MTNIEEFKKEHLKTYKNAVIEIIKNNTNSLIDGDILSLIKEPPLDSMDLLKMKLLTLAKREKIILENKNLEKILKSFRMDLADKFIKLKEIRDEFLISKTNNFQPIRETELIKITKSDLDKINKEMKKKVKIYFQTSSKNNLLNKLDSIYSKDTFDGIKDKITNEFTKYVNNNYQKQLNENLAIKTLVKDRTLLSGIAEQGERYLFTKANSHIFDTENKNAIR